MPDPTPPPAHPILGQCCVQASVLEVRRRPDGLYALIRLALINPGKGITICAQESECKVGYYGLGQVVEFRPLPLWADQYLELPPAPADELPVDPEKPADPGF